MRKMVVTCDVCQADVKGFNGSVSVALLSEVVRADVCSRKCLAEFLYEFAGRVLRSDALASLFVIQPAAVQQNSTTPVAMPTGAPSADAPSTKVTLPAPGALEAALDVAREMGASVMVHDPPLPMGSPLPAGPSGPCACPPANWTMTPPDSSTPGPRDVSCKACGAAWKTEIRAVQESTTPGEAAPKRGKGRPAGSKNKRTLEAEAAAQVATPAAPAANAPTVILAPTPIPAPASSPVDLSMLVTQIGKYGVHFSLLEVAQWTSMQLDLVRSWLAHPEFDPPEFLVELARTHLAPPAPASVPVAPPASPASPASPAPPAPFVAPDPSRFSFT